MFDNLYNKVFLTEDAEFNPRLDVYNVAFNFIANQSRSDAVSAGLARYLNKNCYVEKHFGFAAVSELELGEFVRSRSRYKTNSQADTCYTLIFDYEGVDIFPCMCEAVNIIRYSMNSSDKVM